MTDTYQYYDNETIGDLLVRAANQPELITQFRDRTHDVGRHHSDHLQTFINDVMPLDRYIEVRTLPA